MSNLKKSARQRTPIAGRTEETMKRLTEEHWRNLDPWECCGQDRFCGRGCNDLGGCTNGCIVPKLYARLAAYEDTGLEPEEINALLAERDAAIADIYHMGGCPNCRKNLGRSERTGLPICADNREYPNGSCFEWQYSDSKPTISSPPTTTR